MRKTILLLLIFQGLLLQLAGQEQKKSEKTYKNTVRFNLTNQMLFGGRSLIFGYERVLKKNRSFSVNMGQASFPPLSIINSDSLRADKLDGEKGYHISADYRFYLSKENKYDAPRGVYIGPYVAYNYFERENNWSLKSTNGGSLQTVASKTSLSVFNLGAQMGYQFIFWKRVSLDMILLGPGIAFYDLKASLGSNLSEEDKKKFFEKLNEALEDKFPGYSRVIDEGEFENKGPANTTSLGFRYMIMVGFRFELSKKQKQLKIRNRFF